MSKSRTVCIASSLLPSSIIIPWAERRQAMGDVTLSLLDGKHRVAETVFGWNRSTVAVGINEFHTGIACINDLSTRLNPKSEVKNPKLLADIHDIILKKSVEFNPAENIQHKLDRKMRIMWCV